MPLSLVVDGYAAAVAGSEKSPAVAAVVDAPEAVVPAAANISVDELIEGLQEELAPLVGPMAGMIVEDSVEVWEAGGRNVARIDALVDLICQEIGDDDKADAFRLATEVLIADLKKG